jgi:hypothetical protein
MEGTVRPITVAVFAAMFLLISHLQGSLQAYLDPNTGSMALQLLLAGAVGTLTAIRLYWDRMKTFILRRQSGRTDTSEQR